MTISQAEFNLHARHRDFLRVDCCADGDCASLDGPCSQSGYCVQPPVAAETSPVISFEFTPTNDPEYCSVILYLSRFAGCMTYTGQFSAKQGGYPFDFGTRNVETDLAGSDVTGLGSFVKSSVASRGDAFLQFQIGATSSGYQEVICS